MMAGKHHQQKKEKKKRAHEGGALSLLFSHLPIPHFYVGAEVEGEAHAPTHAVESIPSSLPLLSTTSQLFAVA